MSKKLTILVDMDSISADLQRSWYSLYNKEYDDDLTCDRIVTWDTHMHVKAECGHRIYEYLTPELFRNLHPINGAVAAVEELVRRGHNVVFLTHSPVGCRDAKEAWTHEHFPFVKEMMCAKSKFLVNGDVLIDDGPMNIKMYRDHHPNSNIFSIGYPYNACVEHLLDLRIGSWKDTKGAWDGFLSAIEDLVYNHTTSCEIRGE